MKNVLLAFAAIFMFITADATAADIVLTNDLEDNGHKSPVNSATLKTSSTNQTPEARTYKPDPWDKKMAANKGNEQSQAAQNSSSQPVPRTIVIGDSPQSSAHRDPWDPQPKNSRRNNRNNKKEDNKVSSSTAQSSAEESKEEKNLSFDFTPQRKNPVGTVTLIARSPAKASSLTPIIIVQNLTLSKNAQALVDSCNKYNYKDCIKLADALYEGKIIPKDTSKGYAIYEMLCDLNRTDTASACTKAADAAADGDGVKQSKKNACALYEKACLLDDAKACDSAAKAYENGQGVPQNMKKAQELYGKACVLDNTASCNDHYELQKLYNQH